MSDGDFGADGEIEIPIIEIAPGWTVDEIETLDDCDDAYAYLTGAIAAIESKIESSTEKGTDSGLNYRRLKAALRWKKAAMQVVQTKRGKIGRMAKQEESNTYNQRLLKIIQRMFPEQFGRAVAHLNAEFCVNCHGGT